MRYLTLELCKAQAIIEHNEDDMLITQMAEAAELAVENYLQCPLEEYEDADGRLPADIMQGMMLFFASEYNQREAFTSFNVNTHASILALLNPRIRYGYSRRLSEGED